MLRPFALALLVLATVTCSGVPARYPDMEGAIREVDFPGTGTGALLVEAVPLHVDHVPAARFGDRVLVRITEKTRIIKDIGGVYEDIPFREVVSGDRSRVKVWFVGPVTKSYPAQAEAQVVLYWRLAP